MKKTKQEFYRLDSLLNLDCEYNILIGERSNGKSYAVKEYLIKRAIDNDDHKFIYLRRYSDDIKKNTVQQYLSDMDSMLMKYTDNKYNNFKCANGRIFVEYINEDGEQEYVKHIGYYRSLSQAERMKSNAFLDVDSIVFEEFIATQMYLANETTLFESIISTVARRRRIKVFMIGNTISRNCIYFNHFSLVNVPKQKQGTIDVYNKPTEPPQYTEDGIHISVKVGVELCETKTNNTHMFFGNSQKSITNGAWSSEVQPRIELTENHIKVHMMVVKFRMAKFLCTLINDNATGDLFWYVEPKTTSIQKNTRVISDEISPSALYSSALVPLNHAEHQIFELLKNGKTFFSDNLTGTEFKEALKYFINNKGWS